MSDDQFTKSLSYAIIKHQGQNRKGTAVPYITHPIIVAETIAYYYPDKPQLWQAALLHDVVEDTGVSAAELTDQFGQDVADLVMAVSKAEEKEQLPRDKRARWRAEREHMLAAIDNHSADAVRLKAADALANMKAILRDLRNPEVGTKVWDRFKVGQAESLWYYQEILQRVKERLKEESIYEELSFVFEQLTGT